MQASDMTQNNDGSPGSAGRFVVPYVMFRRLRLEAIRNALGLGAQSRFVLSMQVFGRSARWCALCV